MFQKIKLRNLLRIAVSFATITMGLSAIAPTAQATGTAAYEIRLTSIVDTDGSSAIDGVGITGTSVGLAFIQSLDPSWNAGLGPWSNEFNGYATAGHTVTVKYRVWDKSCYPSIAASGCAPVANQVVYLRVNQKGMSWNGHGSATFSQWTAVPDWGNTGGSCGFQSDCADLKATSDANGYVSWTLTNTNVDADAELRPLALNGTPRGQSGTGYLRDVALQPTFTPTTSNASVTNGSETLDATQNTNGADITYLHIIKQFVPQVIAGSTNATATFESGDTKHSLVPFEGAISTETTTTVYAGSKSLGFVKPAGAQPWAGVTVITQPCTKKFSTTYSVKVYAPDTSTVRLKIEDASGTAVEGDATPSSGGSWQTLTWDFASNGSFSSSVNYVKLTLFPAFMSTAAGQVYYFDDLVYSTTDGTNACPVPPAPAKPKVYLTVVEDAKITVTKDSITCTPATYKLPATEAVYYLYVNGKPVSGKATTAKAAWMHAWDFVPMSYKSATMTDGATWKILGAWNQGKASKVQCLVKAWGDGYLEESRTQVTHVEKVGRLVRGEAVSDITMRLVEPKMTKTSGVPVDYVDFSYDPIQNNWAKYYGPNLGVFYKYFEAGSTFNVTYKVTNSATGSALAGRQVWLIVNKNYGGNQAASFTYMWNEEKQTVQPHGSDLGETQIPGITDENGMVTFTLTNTNSQTEAEPKPAKLYEIQPASVTPLFSTITLTAHLGSDETHETKDIIWGHFVKK